MLHRATWLAYFGVLTLIELGCRTPSEDTVIASEGSMIKAPQAAREEEGGYFVTVEPVTPDQVRFYDRIFDAVHAHARRVAQEGGDLSSYLEEHDKTGYTHMVSGDDEIECDRAKCLFKLSSRKLVSASDAASSQMAANLVRALAETGVTPKVTGSGSGITKTYVVTANAGKGVRCSQNGFGAGARFDCVFDLDLSRAASSAEVNTAGRGRLAHCAMSPGVVRSAEEARREIENGALLSLTGAAGQGSKPVGFLRYVRQAQKVEFVDVYLCGDVSHDYFQLDGGARDPKSWIPAPPRAGGSVSVEPGRGDDAELKLTAEVAGETPDEFVLSVRFEISGAAERGSDRYGDDQFFMRVAKTWTR